MSAGIPTFEARDGRKIDIIFIHSELDDLGLSLAQFRIYAHIARRASSGKAYPKVATIAQFCGVCENTVRTTIRELEGMGLIQVQRNKNLPSVITLQPVEKWKVRPSSGEGGKNCRGSSHEGCPSSGEGRLYSKGNPLEGNPGCDDDLFKEKEQTLKAEVNPLLKKWREKGFPKIVAWEGPRERAFRARWKEKGFRENWEQALDKLAASDWWRERGFDIDWFLKPGSWAKLIEGKYDNRKSSAPSVPVFVQVKNLRQRIETHPANREYIKFNHGHTPAEKQEYLELKAQLKALEATAHE